MERLKVMKFPPIFGQRIKVESEGRNRLKLRGVSAPHHLISEEKTNGGKKEI